MKDFKVKSRFPEVRSLARTWPEWWDVYDLNFECLHSVYYEKIFVKRLYPLFSPQDVDNSCVQAIY